MPPAQRPTPVRSTARVDYEREIKPILSENCLECHSQDKRKGGLSLATYGDMLDGGKDGAVVRPGHGGAAYDRERLTGERRRPDAERRAAAERRADRAASGAGSTRARGRRPLRRRRRRRGRRRSRSTRAGASGGGLAGVAARRSIASSPPTCRAQASAEPALVGDAGFARRAYLDLWGLLPPPDALQAFVADKRPDKRARAGRDAARRQRAIRRALDLVLERPAAQRGRRRPTSPRQPAAEHHDVAAARRSTRNLPYDRFVAKLLNPRQPGDPEGFLIGVNWRGETSAAVTPWMQASQNTAQVFLGVNLKCNACHDSFVSQWKLKDAYGLAGYFSPEPKLQLFRCDVAQDKYAEPAFLYPGLSRAPRVVVARRPARGGRGDLHRSAQRPAAADASSTGSGSGWSGHGIVANADEMDGKPWSPALLDWLASDFVDARLRPQAPDRDDHDVARVPDAGGARDGGSRRPAATPSADRKSAA